MPTYPTVSVEVAPAYEFLLSLSVLSDMPGRHTYELGDAWFDAVERDGGPELLAAVHQFSASHDWVWAHLINVALESPPPRDVPSFIAYLDTLTATEVMLHLVGYFLRHFRRVTPPDVIHAAVEGDPVAQQQFLETSYPLDDRWQTALSALLSLGPHAAKERLLDILNPWNERVFSRRQDQLLAILERDAEERRAQSARSGPAQLVEGALQGVEYIPEGGIRHVVLAPSAVARPAVHMLDRGDTKILCYPVSDAAMAAQTGAPPPRLVRVLKALGDERRLRILHRLGEGEFTLQELSTHFDTGNTTMLHHLVILRAAGLVEVRGTAKRYRMRREPLDDLPRLIDLYLPSKRQ